MTLLGRRVTSFGDLLRNDFEVESDKAFSRRFGTVGSAEDDEYTTAELPLGSVSALPRTFKSKKKSYFLLSSAKSKKKNYR